MRNSSFLLFSPFLLNLLHVSRISLLLTLLHFHISFVTKSGFRAHSFQFVILCSEGISCTRLDSLWWRDLCSILNLESKDSNLNLENQDSNWLSKVIPKEWGNSEDNSFWKDKWIDKHPYTWGFPIIWARERQRCESGKQGALARLWLTSGWCWKSHFNFAADVYAAEFQLLLSTYNPKLDVGDVCNWLPNYYQTTLYL